MASCKEEVFFAATPQERQKREAKANADEAASELHNIGNIGEDSERKKSYSWCFYCQETEIVSKAYIEESDGNLSEHVA